MHGLPESPRTKILLKSLTPKIKLQILIEVFFLHFWLPPPKSCAAESCSLLLAFYSAPAWPAPRRLSTVNLCYMRFVLKLLKVFLISAFIRRKIIPTSHSSEEKNYRFEHQTGRQISGNCGVFFSNIRNFCIIFDLAKIADNHLFKTVLK